MIHHIEENKHEKKLEILPEVFPEVLNEDYFFEVLNKSWKEWARKPSKKNTKLKQYLSYQQNRLYLDFNCIAYSMTIAFTQFDCSQREAWDRIPEFVEIIKEELCQHFYVVGVKVHQIKVI